MKEAATREEELRRKVRGLLNKITPDNLETIVDRLAEFELFNIAELELVIAIIVGKALREPRYCSTYADMVYILCTAYPEFPPEREGDRPQNCRRVLLNACQTEFESSPTSLELTPEETATMDAEEIHQEKKRRKDRLLANMTFIGGLFLRSLLAVKVMASIIGDLIGAQIHAGGLPQEHKLESAVELLTRIGHALDQHADGRRFVTQFISRLSDLKQQQGPSGKLLYSPRIRFLVQGLQELRGVGWMRKLHHEEAKTLDEIKSDHKLAERTQGKGGGALFQSRIEGLKPQHLEWLRAKAEKMAGRKASLL